MVTPNDEVKNFHLAYIQEEMRLLAVNMESLSRAEKLLYEGEFAKAREIVEKILPEEYRNIETATDGQGVLAPAKASARLVAELERWLLNLGKN